MRYFLALTALVMVFALTPVSGDEPRPGTLQTDAAALEKKIAALERHIADLRQEVQALQRKLQARAVAEKTVIPIAWGKAKSGLQAGIALRPAGKHAFHVGDTVRFEVVIRNASDRPIEMPYLAVPSGARVGPSVLALDGKRPSMSGPAFSSVGGRAIIKLALATGEEKTFALSELIFGPVAEPRVQEKTVVQAGPGKYRVSYNVYFHNADETGNYLSTGEVMVDVAPLD
jgi:hypothetical protein